MTWSYFFKKSKMILGMLGFTKSLKNLICQICPLKKQSRLSFSHKTKAPFELILKTYNSCNQLLTVVDNFSRFTWVYMLKHRKDCIKALLNFITHIDIHYNAKILRVRLANASYLCQSYLKELFLNNCIFHQTNCSHTSQ